MASNYAIKNKCHIESPFCISYGMWESHFEYFSTYNFIDGKIDFKTVNENIIIIFVESRKV